MQTKMSGGPDPVGGGGWLVARLGVVGDVGYGGCKPRMEGINNLYIKVLYNIKNN